MSVDTLKAAQSFLKDQTLQVKTEADLEEMIEARCYVWFLMAGFECLV